MYEADTRIGSHTGVGWTGSVWNKRSKLSRARPRYQSIAGCLLNRAIVSEECAPSSQPTSNSPQPVELHFRSAWGVNAIQ